MTKNKIEKNRNNKNKIIDTEQSTNNIKLVISEKNDKNINNNNNKCSEQQKKLDSNCNLKGSKVEGLHGLFGASGNTNRDRDKKDPLKNKYIYDFLDRMPYLKQSFTKNYIFWSVYLIGIIFFSLRYGTEKHPSTKIISGIVSIFIAMIFGWWVHMISHSTDFLQLYDDLLKSESIFGKLLNYLPEFVHNFIRGIAYYVLDFHDKIHHDSTINKRWYNVLMEGLENLLMEGGFIIIVANILNVELIIKNSFINDTFRFNNTLIFIWGLLYTTVHLINYRIIHPNPHIEHHMDYYTNYGIDTIDILFNTKYDIKGVEVFNHGTINIIVIFVLIYLLKESELDYSIIKYLQKILE